MTSLYYVTEHIKLVAKWAGIVIGAIIVLIFLYRFFFFIKNVFFPTPPPPPTTTWGKLPPINFPQSEYLQQFEYENNTVSGTFPKFPDRMPVDLIATPQASLQSLRNTRELVRGANFDSEDIRISESVYQWINPNPPQPKIQYDIVSKNFLVTSNYQEDEEILNAVRLPDAEEAQIAAENYLANFDAFPGDFAATKSAVTFFTINDGELIKTSSLSNAQIIRVDFFQKDLHQLPIYYPKFDQAMTYVLLADSRSNEGVVEAKYIHHTITDLSGTYPIITADEAFALLKKGQGFVARYKGNAKKILIQNVSMGYYLDENTNTYAMPIYVFFGDNDFVGYVSAIKEEWIHK